VGSEHNLALEHQCLVHALSDRTYSLPLGHSLFAYRSVPHRSQTAVAIPEFCLSAKILPQGSVVQPDATVTAADRRAWPEFHNGVASALRLVPGPEAFDSSELTLNRPNELDSRHAGFLMGLGLNGSIRSLAGFQAFRYLDSKHEQTSIGLLLGLACAYAGTGDAKVMSVLSVHLSALHPPNSTTLNLSLLTQAAGLIGVGLLNIGNGRRSLADTMVKELSGLTVVGTQHPDGCREAYALAAGFAFGMIMLGKGNDVSGPGDPAVLRTFRGLLLGDSDHPLPGCKGPPFASSQAAIDVNVTSSAATVALALAFLNTSRKDVIDLLEIPQSRLRLEYVRPDLILLRAVARCLIAWKDVQSSKAWVDSQVPPFLRQAAEDEERKKVPMPVDVEMAYWSAVAGVCLAVGLKFAGTAREDAHAALISYVDRLIKAYSVTGAWICFSILAVCGYHFSRLMRKANFDRDHGSIQAKAPRPAQLHERSAGRSGRRYGGYRRAARLEAAEDVPWSSGRQW
jgi:anaphase-promoting complex subunit 1